MLLSAAPAQQEAATPAAHWQQIQAAGKLVLGTSADYPPFEFYNSKFELDGFDIALAKALGDELGVTVEFKDYAFDGLLDALRLGNVDAAIAAISVTPERQAAVDFTNIYYLGETSALAGTAFTGTVRAASDLAGAPVGVQRGTTFQGWAQQHLVDSGYIPQDALLTYATPSAMIRDLRNGSLDLALMGQQTAASALRQYGDELNLVGDNFYKQQFAIAVPKGSDLSIELNRALLALQSSGVFAQLVDDYLQVNPASVTPDAEAGTVENVIITETAALTPTVAPCVHSMAYVADLNLDDANMTAPPIMAPGQQFAKGWRLQNSGTCAWEPDFALAYVNGNRIEAAMGGGAVPVGRAVQPGETVDIYAQLQAPQSYGTFQGFWQMRNSAYEYFGEVTWVGIQVPDPNPPPPPPPVDVNPNLRADADWITAGQCTTIRWDVDNVAAVYFVEGDNVQGVGGHDARNVCPGGTTTYALRITRQDGATQEFPITINVNGNPDYSINFWADNYSLDGGQCTALRWDVRNVREVYLDNEGVPGVSARDVCPGGTQTYTLRVVKHDGGEDSRQVTVDVRNAPPPPPPQEPRIERFSVNENRIHLGECVRLEWRTDNADGVDLIRNGSGIGGGSGNGEQTDCPGDRGLYEYRLEAYNGAGRTGSTVTVEVSGIQPR
jgi:polar amino acid transport system substrate-binding protein